MTRYEQFTSLTIGQLAQWIDAHGQFDGSPWLEWFDRNYCSKCEPVYVTKEDSKEKLGFELLYNIKTTCAYCEINKECKFFPGRENPSMVEIIEMWLKEPVENEK